MHVEQFYQSLSTAVLTNVKLKTSITDVWTCQAFGYMYMENKSYTRNIMINHMICSAPFNENKEIDMENDQLKFVY